MLRVKLVGNHMDPGTMVTGLICGVLGRELDDGTLWVSFFIIFSILKYLKTIYLINIFNRLRIIACRECAQKHRLQSPH